MGILAGAATGTDGGVVRPWFESLQARRSAALVSAVVFAAVAIAGSVSVVHRASAALQEVAETGQPGRLVLRSDPASPQWTDMRPGDSVEWLIEASLTDVDEGSLSLQLSAEGELLDAGAMTVHVQSCAVPFQRTGAEVGCAVGGRTVLPTSSLAQVTRENSGGYSNVYDLAALHSGSPRHLLVSLSMSPSADQDATADASARIGIGLHAAGETPQAPDGVLAVTGSDLVGDVLAVALLGVGVTGLGLSLALWRSSRRRSPRTADG